MKIGIIISRIGGVDGVALETEKWIYVLKKLGHKVNILTGKLERELTNTPITIMPELDFHHTTTLKEQKDLFFNFNIKEENRLYKWLIRNTDFIQEKLWSWVKETKPDLLIIQNASALPSHLRLGIALKRVVDLSRIPTIAHNHDFAWERGDRYDSKYKFVKDIVANYYPLISPEVQQVVINSYNQKRIKEIYSIDSTLIPNVMDFTNYIDIETLYENLKPPKTSEDIKKVLGIPQDAIMLFQITRIVQRKNIEAAITLIAKLADPKFVLVITGLANDDLEGDYYQKLVKLAKNLKIEDQVFFAGRHFKFSSDNHNNFPVFALDDAYKAATACTYFSLYEGFGNAFTEAVLFRKPIFVNNYQPVYWTDIGSYGFKTVQIEDGKLTDAAVEEIREILTNHSLRRNIVEHNYKIGAKYFSFEVLEGKLKALLS